MQKNTDGKPTRSKLKNSVKKPGGIVRYKGADIDYDLEQRKWLLNARFPGKTAGRSLSDLSKDLYKLVREKGFNETTYDLGIWLETQGYEFHEPFSKNPKQQPNQQRTFIITYNPSKWPESKIQKLINRLNDGDAKLSKDGHLVLQRNVKLGTEYFYLG